MVFTEFGIPRNSEFYTEVILLPRNSDLLNSVEFHRIPCSFLHTEFRTFKREIHWGEIWEEMRRERDREKEIQGKETEGKRQREMTEGKRQRERDRGKETEGKRQRERNTGKETQGKRHLERDTGKET